MEHIPKNQDIYKEVYFRVPKGKTLLTLEMGNLTHKVYV